MRELFKMENLRMLYALTAFALAAVPASAAENSEAGEEGKAFEFTVLPGESSAMGHSLSASRDTALLAYQVLPRVVLSMGGDFAFFGFRFSGLDLRVGLFGLIEVETAEAEPLNFLSVPTGPYLWRGLMGYSLSLSFEDLGRRLLGDRGMLEASIAFRHESEHYTGDRFGNGPMYEDVPNIGNFFMPTLAAGIASGILDIDVRVQGKIFLPNEAYSFGPGTDLIFRVRALKWAHPFVSVFAEYLFGDEINWYNDMGDKVDNVDIPDNGLLRGLVGIVFPGRTAELQVFMAMDMGHDKGLLAFEKEMRLGWGIRVSLFTNGAS